MANLTTTEANAILDARLALIDQVRLMTVNGDATTAGTEVTGGSYAPAVAPTWAAAAAGASSNTTVVSFTNMPAVTVVGVELWDTTPTTPVRRWFGALTTSRTLTAGDDCEFAVGELDVTLS
jgi:hypothetical protein